MPKALAYNGNPIITAILPCLFTPNFDNNTWAGKAFDISFRAPDGGAVQSRTLQATGREAVASGRDGYQGFLVTIFGYLQKNTAHLILDLRGNEGGHPIFAAILFSYLTQDSFTWFDDAPGIAEELAPLYQSIEPAATPFTGKLYVLTDGACLSTTGHLLAHLQARGIGVMIGEMPGSFASCHDNSTRVARPYSGIQANIARSTFTIALPEGTKLGGPVLAREVRVTIKNLLKGEDAGLEACFQLIEEQE